MPNLFEARFNQSLWDNPHVLFLKMENRMEAYRLANHLITQCKPFAHTVESGHGANGPTYFLIVNIDTDLDMLAKRFRFVLER